MHFNRSMKTETQHHQEVNPLQELLVLIFQVFTESYEIIFKSTYSTQAVFKARHWNFRINNIYLLLQCN